MHYKEIAIRAVQKWGKEHQTDKAIEEMAELTNELVKAKDNRTSLANIVDEIADVKIMISQLEYIYGIEECEKQWRKKLERLRKRLYIE